MRKSCSLGKPFVLVIICLFENLVISHCGFDYRVLFGTDSTRS